MAKRRRYTLDYPTGAQQETSTLGVRKLTVALQFSLHYSILKPINIGRSVSSCLMLPNVVLFFNKTNQDSKRSTKNEARFYLLCSGKSERS